MPNARLSKLTIILTHINVTVQNELPPKLQTGSTPGRSGSVILKSANFGGVTKREEEDEEG